MVLRSVELDLVDRFLYACLPWFTSSSAEHDGNFFGLAGANRQPNRYEISVHKNDYTGLISTPTKFQFDPKK